MHEYLKHMHLFFKEPYVIITLHSKQDSSVRDQVVFLEPLIPVGNFAIRDQVVFLTGKSGQKAAYCSRLSCILTAPVN